MKTLLKSSLVKSYLLQVLPVLLLVAVMFLLILVYQEKVSQQRIQDQYYQGQATQLAFLLSEPVWQFSEGVIQNALEATQEGEAIQCVSLRFERDLLDTVQAGQCSDQGPSAFRRYQAPVVFEHQGREERLAEVKIDVKPVSVWGLVYKEVVYLFALSVLLCLALAVATLMAFRKIILKPLDRVAKSLRFYKKTGEREKVDWYSQDELGDLITEYNSSLERQLAYEREVSEARILAEEALQDLKQAQESLIQSEKMASLGGIVAGVAHEINTPVGNCVTVASSMDDMTQSFKRVLASGALKRSQLDEFVSQVEEAGHLLNKNLHRTAELVSNFKQVAVDQTSSQRRSFDLDVVVNEVVFTLQPQIKHSPHKIIQALPKGIRMDSFPGPLGQVVANAVNNALIHAFDESASGEIRISAQLVDQDQVELSIADDGQGMPAEFLQKAFEPFFTTRLGQGGSGLGLHLVYSIVRGVLGGQIELSSEPGQGLVLTMRLPLIAPKTSSEESDERSREG